MTRFPAILYAAFVLIIALQIVGIALLPRTLGLTRLIPTIGMYAAFGATYWIIARMIKAGVNLGILIPINAAVVPIATVIMGVLLYGESASPARLVLLGIACILIGAAARF